MATKQERNHSELEDNGRMIGAVNVNEAARLLGIKRTYAYALMERGELHYAKIGRRRVVQLCEIQRFLEAHLIVATE